jgi:hypothetical protein
MNIFDLFNLILQIISAVVPEKIREVWWDTNREIFRQYFAFGKIRAGTWVRLRRKPITFGIMLLGVPIGSLGVLLSAIVIFGVTYGVIYAVIPMLSGVLLASYFVAFGVYSYSFARDTTVDYLRLR